MKHHGNLDKPSSGFASVSLGLGEGAFSSLASDSLGLGEGAFSSLASVSLGLGEGAFSSLASVSLGFGEEAFSSSGNHVIIYIYIYIQIHNVFDLWVLHLRVLENQESEIQWFHTWTYKHQT